MPATRAARVARARGAHGASQVGSEARLAQPARPGDPHGAARAGRSAAAVEREGFRRFLERVPPDGQGLRCHSAMVSAATCASDDREVFWCPPSLAARDIAWETAPAARGETIFCWSGNSVVYPAMPPSFPYITACLSLEGKEVLHFPLAVSEWWQVRGNGCELTFEPQLLQTLAGFHHRIRSPAGCSGRYRLRVPSRLLTAGRPVQLRITLDPASNVETSYVLFPRRDCLRKDATVMRDQIARLQTLLVRATQTIEMHAAQGYRELFPEFLEGERGIVTQDARLHYLPPNITAMADGEVVVSVREGTDHLSRDGRMVLVRSRDGGRTWGQRELMFDLGRCDHRSSPILELPNGDWVASDYRPGAPEGIYNSDETRRDWCVGPTLWSAWSSDRGRTWTHGRDPLVVPGSPSRFAECERHMLRLPSGRLLLAASYFTRPKVANGVALWYSDDAGRQWTPLAQLPGDDRGHCEPSIVRTRSGRLVLVARTVQGLYLAPGADVADWRTCGDLQQCESDDDGRTWSAFHSTGLPSMNSPGHLLLLQDGRLLCSHGSRAYPGCIYLTTSADEGRTWDHQRRRVLADDITNFDNCYPTTAQLADSTLLTVWSGNLFGKFFVRCVRYRPSDL